MLSRFFVLIFHAALSPPAGLPDEFSPLPFLIEPFIFQLTEYEFFFSSPEMTGSSGPVKFLSYVPLPLTILLKSPPFFSFFQLD